VWGGGGGQLPGDLVQQQGGGVCVCLWEGRGGGSGRRDSALGTGMGSSGSRWVDVVGWGWVGGQMRENCRCGRRKSFSNVVSPNYSLSLPPPPPLFPSPRLNWVPP
jgi:hypothetical protein